MKQLIFILALVAFSCNKKDDPKPVTPAPAPITQANTSFRIQSSGAVHVNFVGGVSGTIKNYSSVGGQNPDTTTTMTIKSQKIDFELTTSYPTTLTVNSGHKSYTFIDSTNKGSRTITLW